jgi:hypothetical protein
MGVRTYSSDSGKTRTTLVAVLMFLMLGQISAGVLTAVLLRSRVLADRAGGTLAFVQYAWDRLAGTWGATSDISAFLVGTAAFSWFWLFTLLARSPLQGEWQPPCDLRALVVSAAPWLALCLAVPFLILAACWGGRKPTQNGTVDVRSIVLSFDAEEDWSPRSDMLRMGYFPSRGTYFPAYAYVDSGQLEQLARGLACRGITATFYCTPNLAQARPGTIRLIAELGHEVGLHLHGHNVQSVEYPYVTDAPDDLTNWSCATLRQAVEKSRQLLEQVIGCRVLSFRSGGWATNRSVVDACRDCGFTNVSNTETTFRLPNGLWQIEATRAADVLTRPDVLLEDYAVASRSNLVPIFSHPMILYNRSRSEPREGMLEDFFAHFDELRRLQPGLRFVTAGQAAAELRYIRPHLGPVLGLAVFSIFQASLTLVVTARWCNCSRLLGRP